MDRLELGKKIRQARQQKGFTQHALAQIADIGDVYMGEIERGLKMPSLNIFIKLIEALDISADYVLRDALTSGQEYTFDEIKYVDIAVKKVRNDATIGDAILLEGIPCKFSQHFDEEDYQSNNHGYKTSSIECDTLITLEADTYRVVSYTTKSSKSSGVLEVNDNPALTEFAISDNKTTDTKVKVTLYESDEYIKDNYALYEIWKSLDGENWSYDGES